MRKEVHPALSALVILVCLAAVGLTWTRLTDVGVRPDLTRPKTAIKEAIGGGAACPPVRKEPVVPVNGVWEYGDPKAILQIEAVLQLANKPGEAQDPLCSFLQGYSSRVPARTHATIYDLDSEAGKAELKRRGWTGPAIVINGRYTFDTRAGGKDVHVDLRRLVEDKVTARQLMSCVGDEFISQMYNDGKPINGMLNKKAAAAKTTVD
jgi:hypothetical protein